MTDTLTTALAYASFGLHVLPLEPLSKRPLASLTENGVLDATTDADRIRDWFTKRPDANLGVATGPSNLLVLDVDGPTGEASLDFLTDQLERALPTTRESRTGRKDGGRHLWFTRPPNTPIRSRTGAHGPGLDVKADGGYVVAPPSQHASGATYTWTTPAGTPFAPAPQWILEGIAKPARYERDPDAPFTPISYQEGDGETNPWGAAVLAAESDVVRNAPEGQRNSTLNTAAFRVGQAIGGGHLDAQDATNALLQAALDCGLPHWEAKSVLARAFTDGQRQPRGPAVTTEIPDNWNPLKPNAAEEADLHTMWEPPDPDPDDTDAPFEPADGDVPPGKGKTIVVNGTDHEDLVKLALKSLIHLNSRYKVPRIGQQGGRLVRMRSLPRPDGTAEMVMQQLEPDALRFHLAEAAYWVQRTLDAAATAEAQKEDPTAKAVYKDKPVPPPLDVTRMVLNLSEFPPRLPLIEGITATPVMRPDGTVLGKVGYDALTGMIYNPGSNPIDPTLVPTTPSEEQVRASIALLTEPFVDFPFISEADRANLLALLLTPILRPAIDGPVPMALISATQPGTGKSKLVDTVSIITTGQEGTFTTAPANDEEWQKRILALLMRSPTLTVFDNLSQMFSSSELCAALTAPVYQGRQLGRTEMIGVPVRTTWAATGNNVSVDGEVGRRSYWITLDARTDKPAERTGFKHNPLTQWVKQNRPTLVVAMLTICRAWYANGCPPPVHAPPMGSYEHWVHTLGGVLEHAGIKGFLANASEKAEAADPDSTAWHGLLEYLSQTKTCGYGAKFTASEAAFVIVHGDPHDPTAGTNFGQLADSASGPVGAIDLVPHRLARHVGRDGFTRYLAEAFLTVVGRRFGPQHMRLEKTGLNRRKVMTYQVVQGIEDPPPS